MNLTNVSQIRKEFRKNIDITAKTYKNKLLRTFPAESKRNQKIKKLKI